MKHFYEDVDGWFWFKPAYEFLLDTLPTDRRSVWVELGVYRGRSLAWLIVAATQKPMQLDIVGVDLLPNIDDPRILGASNHVVSAAELPQTGSTNVAGVETHVVRGRAEGSP